MAYGNLPGGGYSGFVKAEQPLAVKKRSNLPIAEWPEEYKEDLEKISSSQDAKREPKPLEEESPVLKYKAKDKPSTPKQKEITSKTGVDPSSAMAYGNLPGGGFSGFIKAKEPLAIKKRSYLPIAEWPEEFKEDLEKMSSSQEAEREPKIVEEESPVSRYKTKDKPSPEKREFAVRKRTDPSSTMADKDLPEGRYSGFVRAKETLAVKKRKEDSDKISLEEDSERQPKTAEEERIDFGYKAKDKRSAPEKKKSVIEKTGAPTSATVDRDLPGVRYSDFIKAEEPLAVKKRRYPPITQRPEEYKEDLGKIPSSQEAEGKQKIVEEESRNLRYKAKDKLSESKKKKAPTAVDRQRKAETDFDEDIDYGRVKKPTPKRRKREDTKRTTEAELESQEKEASFEEDLGDYSKTVSTEKEDDKLGEILQERKRKVPVDEPADVSEVVKRKEGLTARVPRERPRKETRKISKDYSKSILKKKDKASKRKVRKGPKKRVTFDDENLVDYSEASETEESDVAKDDVVIDIGDTEDEAFLPSKEEDVPDLYPEIPTSEEEPEIRVKFRRPRKVPTYTYYKRKRSIFRCSPCVDRLLYSRRVEYRSLKAMLGYPIGALFGFALYWIVLRRLNAHHNYCWLLGICVGAGFALSTQIRCICFLSIPACCGRAGRAFVSTYIVAYILEGPLTNILANAKESMRVISCTASLNLNHTVERFKLMFKPVKEIVIDFVGAGKKVQDDTKQLETAFTDIEKEVRDENEVRESIADTKELDDEVGGKSRVDVIKKKFSKRGRKSDFGEISEKKYGMKSEFRCEDVFNKGIRGCYDSFEKAYDRCHSYLPIIGYLLCWPMKLTFICDMASSLMGRRACDTDSVMNPGFGASVDTADGVQSEFDKDFAVQLQYKLTIPEESADQLVPEDVAGAMKHSFERRKRNLDFFAQLVDRILALLCLLVINSSRKYCNQYLRIIQFDNKYITSYFRHIEARRQKKGKLVLLPLKKAEKLELSNPFSVRYSAEERVVLIINSVKLASELLTVSVLLMFDRIFYEFLDLIKRHANVTYKQTGAHHIKMTIYGDGFVANMVRSILKGFDKKHSLDQVTTTEECLPLPTKLGQDKIIRLYTVFLILLVLMTLEPYTLRLRRVICAFFYPKREKRRIVFLYNDRLKKRRSFLQHMRHRVRKQAREQAIAIDSGVFFSLRKFYPRYFSWLSKLGLGLSRCLICSEKESNMCRLIDCQECPFSYCSDCWQDTEGKCYVCLPDDDTEPSEDSLSDE